MAIWSGLAGHRTWVDYLPSRVMDRLLKSVDSFDARARQIENIYAADAVGLLEQQLKQTEITHLVEFRDAPLRLRPEKLLTRFWKSPGGSVTIWQVHR